MAATLVTQDDVDRLTAAIASPERQVTIGNQTITYRSLADLLAARAELQALLDAQVIADDGSAPRPRRVYGFYGGRGY